MNKFYSIELKNQMPVFAVPLILKKDPLGHIKGSSKKLLITVDTIQECIVLHAKLRFGK